MLYIIYTTNIFPYLALLFYCFCQKPLFQLSFQHQIHEHFLNSKLKGNHQFGGGSHSTVLLFSSNCDINFEQWDLIFWSSGTCVFERNAIASEEPAAILFRHIQSEYTSSRFLQNFGNLLQKYTVQKALSKNYVILWSRGKGL